MHNRSVNKFPVTQIHVIQGYINTQGSLGIKVNKTTHIMIELALSYICCSSSFINYISFLFHEFRYKRVHQSCVEDFFFFVKECELTI